jgi:putative nucleotidyltransferase with HDIG domain
MITGVYRTLFSEIPQLGIVKGVVKNGDFRGVVGMSISLRTLTDLINQTKIQKSSKVFFIDSRGGILANSYDPAMNSKPLSAVYSEVADIDSLLTVDSIIINGRKILVKSSYNREFNWYYLVLADEAELLLPFNSRVYSIWILALVVLAVVLMLTVPVSRSLSYPIVEFSKQMTRFGKKHFFEKIDIKGFQEIEEMSESFNKMTEEIKSILGRNTVYNQQLETINQALKIKNEELENTNFKMKEYYKKVEEMTWITSRMCSSALEQDERFLKDLLEMIMNLIPKADYGSISLIENEKWRFVHAVGHDIETLRELELSSELLESEDEFTVIQNIIGKDQATFPSPEFEKLKNATKPIGSSIIARLKFSGQQLGSLSIDTAAGNDKSFTEEETKLVQAFSNMASAFLTMQKYIQQQGSFQKDLITSMIRLLEIHDPYTKGHSENVARISVKIADAMGLEKATVSRVFWAGLVHDIGKILVPGTILSKPEILTAEEYGFIKEHPTWGANVLYTFEDLKDVARYVKYHHERWDGLGYPEGLEGSNIPLISRVLSVADAFEAMTSDRPYRDKIATEEALVELEKNAGTQFDPQVVAYAIRAIRGRT